MAFLKTKQMVEEYRELKAGIAEAEQAYSRLIHMYDIGSTWRIRATWRYKLRLMTLRRNLKSLKKRNPLTVIEEDACIACFMTGGMWAEGIITKKEYTVLQARIEAILNKIQGIYKANFERNRGSA